MDIVFICLSLLVTGSALAAVSLRNPVHCALCVAVCLSGLALVFLKLNAPFLAWIQILVYVGAVAILIVFAILLTRQDQARESGLWSPGWRKGGAVAFLLFCVLCGCIISTRSLHRVAENVVELSVADMGRQLMMRYVVPLEVMGVLLTAAMIGAVVLAREDR